MNTLLFVTIVSVSVNNKVHSFDKWIIFFNIKRSNKVTLATEVDYERHT